MPMIRQGFVLLSLSGEWGGAGGGTRRQGSDDAKASGDMRACGVAEWFNGTCLGCIRWPQRHGGADAEAWVE